MKTFCHLPRTLTTLALVLLAAALVSAPTAALAQEKGAEKLIKLKPIKTVEDLQKVESGDTIVMSCPKCKDTYVTVSEQSFKAVTGEQKKTVKIHLCSACETRIVTKGHGREAKDVVEHTCKACGSKDVSCCVMKKGQGPTPGMEEKK